MAPATDKKGADKLAEHRQTVADAITSMSKFTDSVNSPESLKMKRALMHMGSAHSALSPTAPATPSPYDY